MFFIHDISLTIENVLGVRSTVEQPTRGAPPQQTVSPPPMMTTLDPRMNNPWFNPNNAPMFNQPPPWMFPPSPGNFDPRLVMQNLGLQDPRLLQSVLPMQRSDWAEMILVFPDGSFQRTIRDFRTMVKPILHNLLDEFVIILKIM